jgi:hypothetical protein
MKRYSIGSRVAQSWLVGQSKFFLDLSGRLDVDGLYRDSESFLNYGVDLSGLLRYSAVDDVRDLGDDIVVDSPDVDIVHVEDVNPNEVLRNDKYWHKGGNNYNSPGMIHRGDIDYVQPNSETVLEAIRAMSVGGGNVFNCLISLSNYMSSIKKILEENNALSSLANFRDVHERIAKKALYSYFKNPLFLENILEVDNIVRDIFESNVNRDTVALFSRVIDLYSGRVKKFSDRREYVEKFIGERVPELSSSSNLVSNLLDQSKVNIEVYLEPIEECVKILRSLGVSSEEILGFINVIDSSLDLTDVSKVKKYLAIFRFSGSISNSAELLEKMDVVPEDLWSYFLKFKDTFTNSALIFYKSLMPDIFRHIIKNYSNGNVKFDDNSYSVLKIYPIYKLCGKRALFDKDYLNDCVNSDLKMSNVYNEKVAKNPKFESKYYDKEGLKQEYLFESVHSSYLSIFEDELGGNFDHTISPRYVLDYLPYYKKFPHRVSEINRMAPFFGDNLLKLDGRAFDKISNDMGDHYRDDNVPRLNYDKEIVSEPYINSVEYWGIRQLMPFMNSIKFSDWLEFHKERHPNDIGSFDDMIQKYGFIDRLKTSGKILYLFGHNVNDKIVNKIHQIDSVSFSKYSKDYLKRLAEDDNFMGDFNLVNRAKIDLNRYTPTEISSFGGDMNESVKDKIATIRKSISRSKNYSGIVWGSPEYNKVFTMIAKTWDCRGRDPKLLTELFDASVQEQNEDKSLVSGLINIASGVNNFETLESTGNGNFFRTITRELDSKVDSLFLRYELLFKDLKLVKEQVINIGGFNVLFSENPDALVNVLRIRENDIENFKSNLAAHREIRKAYFDIVLKVDSNILKNKLSVYGIRKFIDKHPEVKDKLNSGERVILGNNLITFVDELKNIENGLLNDSDNFIPEVYGIKLNFNNNIKHVNNTNLLHLSDFNENLENAGKIIAIFGVDTYRLLDKFSIKLCQSRGLPVKGFKNIPDLGLKATIIHDLGNLLPKHFSGKNDGIADYYLLYLGFDDKNLKFVADVWNNEISLVDEDMNFLESGLVKEFARENDPTKLSKLIKRNNAKSLFENLQPKSTKFALDFIDNFNVPNVKMDDSSPKKILYRGCEDIYLRGLEVPMPFWSDFKATEGDMTLRFLPREDPKGMMLGKITECCQNPESWAASCSYDGHLNPLAAFAVFEINNEIIYQSYVWSDEDGNVCFDSSEASKRDYKSDKDKIAKAKSLLIDFSKSIDGKCNIGTNFLGFYNNTEVLKNPTKTYKSDDVQALLVQFSPNGQNFYSSDSSRQYKVD